jgi:hypothetical protein
LPFEAALSADSHRFQAGSGSWIMAQADTVSGSEPDLAIEYLGRNSGQGRLREDPRLRPLPTPAHSNENSF